MYHLSDYVYDLPVDRIAQTPAHPPESCKLLVCNRQHTLCQDHIFSDLPDLISSDSLLVFNDSKVIPARLPIHLSQSEQKNNPTRGEVFFLRLKDKDTFEALVKPGKKFRVGTNITLPEYDLTLKVIEQTRDGRILQTNKSILHILYQYGQMPLPPYITSTEEKYSDYQPFFAQHPGSVAAPTASLHFSPHLLKRLEQRGIDSTFVTLHVGLGTFKQVDTEDITAYDIHTESIEISTTLFSQLATAKQQKKSILAIGTTVMRTLETLPYLWKILDQDIKYSFDEATKKFRDACTSCISLASAKDIAQHLIFSHEYDAIQFESKLFLYPGKPFFVVDQLITNFHLPKSSLLMLVAAFMGFENMKRCYDHAITNQYRFYSFGDAMLIR